MQNESDVLKLALEREKAARENAEKLLKEKEDALQEAHRSMELLRNKAEAKLQAQSEELSGSIHVQKASHQNLATLIRNLQAGILVEDDKRHIVLANQKFCDLFQIPAPPDELVGMDCSQSAEQSKGLFLHPEQFVSRIAELLAEQKLVMGEVLEMKDGTILERDYIPVFNEEEQYQGHLWQYKNITKRKKDERKLIEATRLAEESSKARETFLANVSHEIRTPMNVILGMTEILLSEQLPQKHLGQIKVVRKSAENLLVLINDLLDISKIDSGKLRLERIGFRMDELLEYIIKTLDVGAKRKQIQLEHVTDPKIPSVLVSDPHRLNQILTNLLTNAIKFTQEGKVYLQSRLLQQQDGVATIEFKVVDTGIGISKDHLEKIFESFRQADESITRRFGGTGLGLTISRKLTELLGGAIAVESQPGVGTTFSLVVPMEVGQESDLEDHLSEVAQPGDALNGKRILLVEDHEYNQILTVSFLEEWGAEVVVADNGQQALDRLQEGNFDLILMDIQMPVMDGLQAASAIRHELKLETPILALSATAQQSEADRCRAAGMDDFMSKPFSRSALFNKVLNLIPSAPVSPAPVQEQPVSPSVDLALLHQHVNGNPKLVQRLVDVFLKSTPKDIALLRQAGENGDLVQAREILHRLRPSVKMMGMKPVMARMEQVSQLEPGKKQALVAHLQEISRLLMAAVDELSDLPSK